MAIDIVYGARKDLGLISNTVAKFCKLVTGRISSNNYFFLGGGLNRPMGMALGY